MNRTDVVYAKLLLEKIGLQDPLRDAIVWENSAGHIDRLSYECLQEQSLRQAINLQSRFAASGKGRHGEIRIGVWLPRTAEYVVTFLSIWFAGAVYVPISDASNERLDAEPTFKSEFENRVRVLAPHLDAIITDQKGVEVLQTLITTQLIELSALSEEDPNSLHDILVRNSQSEAFVYCSSGTTATPKIIVIPFEAVPDRVESVTRAMNVSEGDSILNYTGFDFDPSLMEIFMALHFGGTLLIAPEYARCDPSAMTLFYQKLDAQNIARANIAIIVPSMLKLMDARQFQDLKSLMTTGENVLPPDLASWFEIPNLRIWTGYGPTETCWGATLTEIQRNPIVIHVTHPMKGITLKLLPIDHEHYEILIAGNGFGYYIGENAEESTEKHFIDIEGTRYFRPHDGVLVENEKLHYGGRIDDRIKFHGRWISLEKIDEIVEKHPAVKFATTLSIPNTSLFFVFVVLSPDASGIDSLGLHARQYLNELLPIFFQVDTLRFNSRGKRCRKLTDYQDARVLTPPQIESSDKTLAQIWTEALIESDMERVKTAFATVGIRDLQAYLPQYHDADHFDEWGGKSLKLTRLITLVWQFYIRDPHRSQQNFRIGLMRHRSFQQMSEYIRLYQTVISSFSTDQRQSDDRYACLWVKIDWNFSDDWLEEFCSLLQSEIKSCYKQTFYHLIINTNSLTLIQTLKKQFSRVGVVDNALAISPPHQIQSHFNQFHLNVLLTQNLRVQNNDDNAATLVLKDGETLTRLGTACGKTTSLRKHHQLLKSQGKTVCYLSCRNLKDEKDNLLKALGISADLWGFCCEAEGILSEITWLIDDIECGIADNRLSHLQECLDKYKGKSTIVYCGRESFYPFALETMTKYGHIELLPPTPLLTMQQWFAAEASKSELLADDYFKQLRFLIEKFIRKKSIASVTSRNWWASASEADLEECLELPPLHITQFPVFSSLVRFLRYHDNKVYSIRQEYQKLLENYLSVEFDLAAKSSKPVFTPLQQPQKKLPRYIRHYAGDACLSPWIFFHSISGDCPDQYATLAELILRHTRQSTYTISMPANREWASLEEQVSWYLREIDRLQIIPAGGSYYLLGWSYGGYLAVEAARQLEKNGKNVAAIVTLDSAPIFAHPAFCWEAHEKYVKGEILKLANGNLLIKSMQYQVKLLQEYCSRFIITPKIKGSHYIFEATQHPETLKEVEFSAWSAHFVSSKLFRCDCDHFNIFTDLALNTQLPNILHEHHEQVDPRPLRERLTEKLRILLLEQDTSSSPVAYQKQKLEKRIFREFLNANHSPDLLLIEGAPGIGKSRLVFQVTNTILNQAELSNWIPILLPLNLYLGIQDFDRLLEIYGISLSDLRQDVQYLFIIDGLDEGNLDLISYPLRIQEYGKNSKVVITSRKGIFPYAHYGNRYAWELPPLDWDVLGAWLHQFDKDTDLHIQAHIGEENLLWLKTPFALNMLLKLYHRGFNVRRLIRHPFLLYRLLNEVFFQEHCGAQPFTEEGMAEGYRRYIDSFLLRNSVLHHSPWNYSDPVTVTFRKALQLVVQDGKLIFSHNTWRQFFLVDSMINAVLQFQSQGYQTMFPQILLRQSIIRYPQNEFIIFLLLQYWQSADFNDKFLLRKNLFTILLLTRRFPDLPDFQLAASTAVELLNLFQISFSGLELAEVRVANVDLSGIYAAHSSWRGAKLERVNFTNADLLGTSFHGAELTTVVNNDMRKIQGHTFTFTTNGERLIVAEGGTLILYETLHYQEIASFRISETPISQIIFLSENSLGCYTDRTFYIIHQFPLNERRIEALTFEDNIHQCLLSPSGEEIICLLADGIMQIPTATPQDYSALRLPPSEKILAKKLNIRSQKISYHPFRAELAVIIEDHVYLRKHPNQSLQKLEGVKGGYWDPPFTLSYHPTKDLLIVCGHTLYFIETQDYTVIRNRYLGQISHSTFAFDLSGDRLIVASNSSVEIYSYEDNNRENVKINFSGKAEFEDDLVWHSEEERNNDSDDSDEPYCFAPFCYLHVSPQRQQFIVSNQTDGPIYFVDLHTNKLDRRLDVPSSSIQSVAYHPQGKDLVVQLTDGIYLWSCELNTCLQQQTVLRNHKTSFQAMPQIDSFLFSTPNGISSFHPHSRDVIPLDLRIHQLAKAVISPNGKKITFPDLSGRSIIEEDITLKADALADISGNDDFVADHDNTKRSKQTVTHIAYLPPGDRIVIAYNQEHLNIWTPATEALLEIPDICACHGFSVSPDGELIIARSALNLNIVRTTDPFAIVTFNIQDDNYFQNQIIIHHHSNRQFALLESNSIVVIERDADECEARELNHPLSVGYITDICYRPRHHELAAISGCGFKPSFFGAGKLLFWNIETFSFIASKDIFLPPDQIHYDLHLPQANLRYSPRGDYLAWGGFLSTIEIWNADTRECIQKISVVQCAKELAWLDSAFPNTLGNPFCYLAFLEKDVDLVVYEVAKQQDASVEAHCIWGTSRHSHFSGGASLQVLPTEPAALLPLTASPSASHPQLDAFLSISDYLMYKDYCYFIFALQISAEKLRERNKRPVIDLAMRNKLDPKVGEQLQRFGFFVTSSAVDIHHLSCKPSNAKYESLIITTEHGKMCGDVNAYILDDMIRLA